MFKESVINLLWKEVGISKEEINRLLEMPPQEEMGDWALPCFELAKIMKKAPVKIAGDISSKLKNKLPKEISSIKSVNGYVNFFINKDLLATQIIKEILDKKEKYGSENMGDGEKVLVEHTSLNPNSEPHVGRARNAIIGDSIVRLLRFQNYEPEVHFYINDVSKQVAIIALGCKGNETLDEMLKIYIEMTKKVEKNAKLEQEVFKILSKIEQGDKKTIEKTEKIVEHAVKGQVKVLSHLGIKYDKFDFESEYIKAGQDLIEDFDKTGKLFKDKDGRFVLDESGCELEKEMRAPMLVLTRSNGTGLYVLRDLAYNIEKLKKTQSNIIILGEEQKLYFKQLAIALDMINKLAPRVVHYSFVLIKTKEGKSKMSTRRGEVVMLKEFINEAIKKAKEEIAKRKSKGNAEEIAKAAIKYSMLKVDENKNIVFDWEEALNFEGESGPYLQYSVARANSILEKIKKEKKNNLKIKASDKLKLGKEEISLTKQLALFKNAVHEASKQLAPHIIATYSYELAKKFNEFYATCPVMNAKGLQKSFRIELVRATIPVLENSLNILGISPIKKM